MFAAYANSVFEDWSKENCELQLHALAYLSLGTERFQLSVNFTCSTGQSSGTMNPDSFIGLCLAGSATYFNRPQLQNHKMMLFAKDWSQMRLQRKTPMIGDFSSRLSRQYADDIYLAPSLKTLQACQSILISDCRLLQLQKRFR